MKNILSLILFKIFNKNVGIHFYLNKIKISSFHFLNVKRNNLFISLISNV